MSAPRLRAVLIGAGKVGMGYADDPITARHYPFATHAQVLSVHPEFEWVGVVDPSEEARRLASEKWGMPFIGETPAALSSDCRPEIAVLATPPGNRIDALKALPSLRAVLVEKPLGKDVAEAKAFLDYCQGKDILVQANLWRRADEGFQALAAGGLKDRIGKPQAVFGIYGNGLANNGTHMIDMARMLLGDIESVQVVGAQLIESAGPVIGDVNIPFSLRFKIGISALFHPVSFSQYRENAMEIWGQWGRLDLVQEGLGIHVHPRRNHRAVSTTQEIDFDSQETIPSTVGHAFFRMYDNLAAAIRTGTPLWAPGSLALDTANIIDSILTSAKNSGSVISVTKDN